MSTDANATNLAGELIAAIRVNSLRGTFKEATHEQIEEYLKPFCEKLRKLQAQTHTAMTMPDNLPPPPAPPEGHHWVYRGTNWDNGGKRATYCYISSDVIVWTNCKPSGCDGHYLEAVRDEHEQLHAPGDPSEWDRHFVSYKPAVASPEANLVQQLRCIAGTSILKDHPFRSLITDAATTIESLQRERDEHLRSRIHWQGRFNTEQQRRDELEQRIRDIEREKRESMQAFWSAKAAQLDIEYPEPHIERLRRHFKQRIHRVREQ